MKIHRKQSFAPGGSGLRGREEKGFVATVLFFALLVIMLMLAAAAGMALLHLHDEVKVLERQQIKRLDLTVTNSVANAHLTITKVNPK